MYERTFSSSAMNTSTLINLLEHDLLFFGSSEYGDDWPYAAIFPDDVPMCKIDQCHVYIAFVARAMYSIGGRDWSRSVWVVVSINQPD